MDLGDLTYDIAKQFEKTTFELVMPDGTVRMTLVLDLVESLDRGRRPTRGAPVFKRKPFALYFLGPVADVLPQGMYLVRSPVLTLDGAFLVPTGQDAEATEYESIFS